jgi:hypothetical protein
MSTLKLNTTSGGSVNLVPDDTAANLTISPQTGYYLPAGTGAVATTVQAKLRESVSVLDFMTAAQIADVQAGTALVDVTTALLAAKTYAVSRLPCELYFPKGIYAYTELGNFAYSGLTLAGESSGSVILKCNNVSALHTALLFDAFASGSPTDPFIQQCNLKNITVRGNSNTLRVIRAQGLARCYWESVTVANASNSVGIGVLLQGCSINTFVNLTCSTDLYPAMSPIPLNGMQLTNGFRAAVDIGQSTNNTFINAIMEGMPVGTNLVLADQNTFIGGTDESCTIYGTSISSTSRFNTFIGRGYENIAGTADVIDAGTSSQFQNCYSLKSIILQGRNAKITGGIHESITVQSSAVKSVVTDLTVNYAGTGTSFTDSGIATEWKNLYNQQTAAFIYPLAARTAIAIGASPATWTNDTGQYVTVVMQTGTVSQTRMFRSGNPYQVAVSAPNVYLLAPTDAIEFTYTVAPSVSYVPQNGFQG